MAWYVDDLLIVSKMWCSPCLEDMLTVMYRKPLQFDRQATSAHGLPWLDMWVSFRGGALEIHMDGRSRSGYSARLRCLPPRFASSFT